MLEIGRGIGRGASRGAGAQVYCAASQEAGGGCLGGSGVKDVELRPRYTTYSPHKPVVGTY